MLGRTEKQVELQKELDALNAAVDEAVRKRTEWMDAHMADFAEYQVGDELYELETGRLFGRVSRLYRLHGTDNVNNKTVPRDARYDRSMSVDYEVQKGDRIYDNTSRTSSMFYGNKEKLRKRFESRLEYLK